MALPSSELVAVHGVGLSLLLAELVVPLLEVICWVTGVMVLSGVEDKSGGKIHDSAIDSFSLACASFPLIEYLNLQPIAVSLHPLGVKEKLFCKLKTARMCIFAPLADTIG